MFSDIELIVFSHLRWNFVFQRPQHLMVRFARQMPVIFIEEPVFIEDTEPRLQFENPQANVTLVRLLSPLSEHGFHPAQIALLLPLLKAHFAAPQSRSRIAWFYTPLALPLLQSIRPKLVVYDCMDALDAFMHAPPELVAAEAELLRRADVVFTGGPSLYRRLEGRHANAHCFSSSVDAAHFAQALQPVDEPDDQRAIPHPRIGYFGVIDERIDLELLEEAAAARPDRHFVMVGPVAKIPEASLPKRSNLYFLGQKSYSELPRYLHGWDVCMLPFALNDATRYISPTKTLEYMAAELPIVSTPITDVVEPYGDIVRIVADAQQFVESCEELLAEFPEERERRVAGMRRVLAATSWDDTVRRMSLLFAESLRSERARVNQAAPDSTDNPLAPPGELELSASIVVVGGGPTGLSAAYHAGDDALLLEQHERVGGWCRSLEEGGFTFDFAGHIMFSNDSYVHELYEKLLGDNVHWQDREAWIYSKQVYTRYPFQGALYGLPPEVIKECLLGAIEARFGSLGKPTGGSLVHANGATSTPSNGSPNRHVNNGSKSNGKSVCELRAADLRFGTVPSGDVKDCCGDGIMESTAKLVNAGAPATNGKGALHGNGNGHAAAAPQNFEEFIYKVWGAGIARHFAIPYNRKIWTVPLNEMETSWLGGRVPLPDLGEMIDGALHPVPKPMGPNARFGYPLRGGFQALMNGFLPLLGERLRLNSRVAHVVPSERLLLLHDGTRVRYEQLISTMPLPTLIHLMGTEVPTEVREAAAGLRHVSVRCVNLGVGREKLTEKHWIYYPEHTVFHRIFVQGNASPHCNPEGGFGLTCEITYSAYKPLPCDGDDLIRRCIAECREVGIIGPDDPILVANQIDMPCAYVIYDNARAGHVGLIREWLAERDILLAGRYGEWEYYNSDHAFIAGKKAAETAASRPAKPKGAALSNRLATNRSASSLPSAS